MTDLEEYPRPDPSGLWSGPECPMCHGTGVYPYKTPEVVWGRCAACNGHGREPNG